MTDALPTIPIPQDVSNASRFLAAFNRIETYLHELLADDGYTGFRNMVEDLAPRVAAVQRLKVDLEQFAELRNAIVHRSTGTVIAEPNSEVVQTIEHIASLLVEPPLVSRLAGRPVVTMDPGVKVQAALTAMSDGSCSHLLVYDGKRFCGLLTADIIVLWLGRQVQRGPKAAVDWDTPLARVLADAGNPERVAFASPEASVFDALELFESRYREGKRLEALIITATGKASEPPIAVMTGDDLAAAHSAVADAAERPHGSGDERPRNGRRAKQAGS
jgi:CBS domain-containing protein